ncbi:MAG: pimeloyl-ACP methyl ester carboxylesterase [Planctomycetota bacterium]|jgi:pimeloyl-ACP methyl ester carboxylesterase
MNTTMPSAKKSTNVRALPFPLRAVAMGLRTLDKFAPQRAATTSARLFCYPPKHARPRREQAWLENATPFRVRLGRSEVRAWRWGSGDRVVFLMHGWAGRGAQLGGMVEPLLKRGLSVVTWDGPGHGDSPGSSSSLVELSDSAFAVARHLRLDPHGIIAHSMGGGAMGLALAEGLDVKRAVLISPPASLLHYVDQYAGAMGFSLAMQDRLTETMNRSFRVNMADFDVEAMRVPGGERLLVIHDEGDLEVPFEHGERVARAVGAAGLIRTEGLGHKRILLSDRVVRTATDWIVDAS